MDEMQERELLEAIKDLSRFARIMYLNLEAEGFLPSEALSLTKTWMSGVQGMSKE